MKQSRQKRQSGGWRGPVFAILIAIILAMTMSAAGVFAAGASDTPDPTSYAVQSAAGETGNTATVTLGKILTCSRDGDFPAVTYFIYTMEAVKAWDNANVSTALSGKEIAAADMPKPETEAGYRAAVISGTKATILVGNFQDTSARNTSSGDGEDTKTRRTRTTPVDLTFAKAGYYVYKVKEAGSIPESQTEGYAQAPLKSVPGVDYDDNEYFVVFYVCNKVDREGNTTGGVYVHSITSYTNTSGSETYQPDLSDIQNRTDHNGQPASENTGQVERDGSVTHQLGKVGVSDPETPNRLEAYRMWNAFVSHDLVLKKNVTGNLGDRSKRFEFTITLTGLEKSKTYTTEAAAVDTGDVTTVEIDRVTTGTKNNASTFVSDAEGKATLHVRMKDDDCLVLGGLPMTSQYRVKEDASDHVASYRIRSSNTASGSEAAVIATVDGSNGTVSDQELATAQETVDRYDDTVTVLFTNNRDLATVTGVPGLDYMAYASAGLLLAAGLMMLVRRRKRYEDEVFRNI